MEAYKGRSACADHSGLHAEQDRNTSSPDPVACQHQVGERACERPFAWYAALTPGGCASAQDQYIELSTALPASASLYGLGESTRTNGFALPRNGSVQTLWARDSPAALPLQNTYSAWPFYMDVRAGGRRCELILKISCMRWGHSSTSCAQALPRRLGLLSSSNASCTLSA